MKNVSRSYAMELAKGCYDHESGRRKAVDDGTMTIEEFAIYKCVSAYMMLNMPVGLHVGPDGNNVEEHDRLFNNLLPDAYRMASQEFGISPEKAEFLFKKIGGIPRVAP